VSISPPIPGFLIIDTAASILSKAIGLLIIPANGRFIFESLYKLANFLKAANEPVNVTPPIKTPKYEAMACNISGLGSAI